jgi:hypothetical protein
MCAIMDGRNLDNLVTVVDPTSVGVSLCRRLKTALWLPEHLPTPVGVSRQIQDAQLVGIGSQSTPHFGGGFSSC